MKTYARLSNAWPLPKRILSLFFSTILTAAYMSSMLSMILVTAIIIPLLFLPALARLRLLDHEHDPAQGRGDRLAREGLLSYHAKEYLGGRTLRLSVMDTPLPRAMTIVGRTRASIIVSQSVYDLPIDKFMGVALHEVGHLRKPPSAKAALLYLIGVTAVEFALAATGLTFLQALQWSSVLTLLTYLPFSLVRQARSRRTEFSCDQFAQAKGGNMAGGLRSTANMAAAFIGGIPEPKPLLGIENVLHSHPSLSERYKVLADSPTGTLDMLGYVPVPNPVFEDWRTDVASRAAAERARRH